MVSPTWHTPPELAQMLGVQPQKVLLWITRGELAAVNVATSRNGRPRWRISPEALQTFLASRQSSRPTPPPPKRRKLSEVPSYV